MRIDYSAAEEFLAYVDGEKPIAAVWEHPAYEIAREQSALLGNAFTPADIERAVAGERTTFGGVENLEQNRDRIRQLLEYVRSNESEWTEQVVRALERIAPDAEPSTVTVYLAVGSQLGIGTGAGAYLNLNEPLFLETPRQLLYTIIHETSHVLYEREHGLRAELGPDPLDPQANQQRVFETVFHTEAFATYAPLSLRQSDENVGVHDHPTCKDYRILSDKARLRRYVEQYDSFRERLREGPVSRETLADRLFSDPRLPYRVGCALLDDIESSSGLEEVQTAFRRDPGEFCDEYDSVLDRYRT